MIQLSNNNLKLAVAILDALDCAKDATALLPSLPPNIKPIYVRMLNAFYKVRDSDGNACISDVSRTSGILLPNMTKLVNKLVELKIVSKRTSATDKRIVLIRATALGEHYIEKYVLSFHQDLEKELSRISESDCRVMIDTIQKIYLAIKKIYRNE